MTNKGYTIEVVDIMPNKRGKILDTYKKGEKIEGIDIGELQDFMTYLYFKNKRLELGGDNFIEQIRNIYIGKFPF